MSHPTPDLDGLRRSVPEGIVATDPETVEKYRYDYTHDATAGVPLAVVRAETAAHVQAAVRWAAEHCVGVVPRGAGSGLSGGSLAAEGAITISTERMRKVTIDAQTRVAEVEPGALNVEVKQAAAEHGLWYPPDPSSYEICSIGGNLATNAGGLCCVKYGVTTDYVLGMDVVLADGRLVTLGGNRIKDVAGLSLTKLFVGSEGTLGIITRGLLRLVPAQAPRATLVATFESLDAAAEAVILACQDCRPAMMELMDNAAINAVERFKSHGLDTSAGALLLAQSDAPGAARELEISAIEKACARTGATEVFSTDDPDEGEAFISARRIVIHAIEATGAILLEDVGAPVPRLPELIRAIAKIARRQGVSIPVVAHAGDGNTHPVIVYNAEDPEHERRARRAFDEVMRVAIELGGTITGEHGVGRLKRGMLGEQLGPDVMELSRRVKQALDPDGILNPGAVL